MLREYESSKSFRSIGEANWSAMIDRDLVSFNLSAIAKGYRLASIPLAIAVVDF